MNAKFFPSLLTREWFLAVSVATSVIFLISGHSLLSRLDVLWRLGFVFAWLFLVILGSALAVVRHADQLARRLGEPYGTLILTLSITSIEVVSISAIMLHGANNPTLARDTLFAVTMIVLNGMVGLSLLMGGWRHREQQYNLQGANAYLGVIIPLGILALVLPNFTVTTPGPILSFAQEMFLAIIAFGLYIAFLALQTRRHRAFFRSDEEGDSNADAGGGGKGIMRHALLLAAYMVPVIYLAEQLAPPVDYVVETMNAPAALAGLTMAILVATPEAIGAVRAAGENHLQRSVNIFLGSVLSTTGLTIPAILVVSNLTDHPVMLGLQHTDLLLFVLTLALCMVTFSSGRTHVLQGLVHLILFVSYLFFIFVG
ncbi:calcium:proton antiporter [Rhodanobacter sp. MP7CTX1]|jgi:Ca2+:H+ antiporter|uniref:calcium:proton antiporter n=1 Tax=Rhodanobacter sp. MP7CTX1 TaxID=2723084 RepID=UPI00161ADCCD|nr:calcium:proton antiporter [Rhodanobacter sp. MP7CTX1]MBB6186197.1 Ca2+:H+ antiporter [Rhodanobacter sp. MP7CTX1]